MPSSTMLDSKSHPKIRLRVSAERAKPPLTVLPFGKDGGVPLKYFNLSLSEERESEGEGKCPAYVK